MSNDRQKMLDQTLFLLAHNNVITRQTYTTYKELVELLRQCLDMLSDMPVKHPSQIAPRDDLIDALRERLE